MKTVGILNKKSNLNLLIVEDDTDMSQFIKNQLNKHKKISSINCVYTFNMAITYLQKNNPTHVVLDLRLPDGNGVDLLKHIKNSQMKTKVFVFSASSELKQTCIRLGADGFFDKSDGIEQLINAILSN